MHAGGAPRRDAAPVVADKDVILAFLGASAGLAGLSLVFFGLVISSLQGFDAETPRQVLRPLRILATSIAVSFGIAIVCMFDCTWWLAWRQSHNLYVGAIVFFVAHMLSLMAIVGASLQAFVWSD
jgi:hypothetical protein